MCKEVSLTMYFFHILSFIKKSFTKASGNNLPYYSRTKVFDPRINNNANRTVILKSIQASLGQEQKNIYSLVMRSNGGGTPLLNI